MPINVEIKARSRNFERQRQLAAALSETPAEEIRQADVFFRTPNGRLKLRTLGDGSGELISYDRADTTGPRQSHYLIFRTWNPESLRVVLSSSLGVRGVVRKHRTLYRVGPTRIHLDRVEGLGDFIEFECVMDDGLEQEEACRTLRRLMDALEIADGDLVAHAYIDLIMSED